MRIILVITVCFLLVVSCHTKKNVSFFEGTKNDTIQFTYLYSEALKNKMLGRNDLAEEQFMQCIQMKPESSASAYQIAKLNLEKKNYDFAKKYSEISLRFQPKNEWYLLLRADIAKALSDSNKYISIFKDLAQLNPGNYNYTYELAVAEFNQKHYNESLALLNYLEKEIGLNENVSLLKNNINFALERYDAIQNELIKLTNAFPDSIKYSDMLADFYLSFNRPGSALKLFDEIIAKDSSNMDAIFGIALVYGKLKQYKKGFPYLLKCIQSNSDFSKKLKVASYYLSADKSDLGDEAVLVIYDSLAEDDNVTGQFLSKYVAFLFQLKELSGAEKVALRLIKEFPDNFEGWDYFFNILLMQNRPEALKKYTKKGLEYFPNHASVYFYCGYSYFLLKDYQNAINYLEMGLDFVIDNEDLEKQFFLTLAECNHNISKHKQSDAYFDKYLAKDSTNAYLMNNYAYYLVLRNNNLDKAFSLSRKSIEIEPFNSSFLDTYAWILYTLKSFDKALNYIQRAYKYGGNKNPVILEHYGDILSKMNRAQEAVEYWRSAYQLNKSKSLLDKINSVKE